MDLRATEMQWLDELDGRYIGEGGARLHRLLKNSIPIVLVSGHGFRRAVKPYVLVIPSGLQPARDLLFAFFRSLFRKNASYTPQASRVTPHA